MSSVFAAPARVGRVREVQDVSGSPLVDYLTYGLRCPLDTSPEVAGA